MSPDEEAIRRLIAAWMAATKARDVDAVLSLIADDAVFLVAGKPPMSKRDFAAGMAAHTAPGGPQFDGQSDIREVKVVGDWAFVWAHLTVVATMPGNAAPTRRSGHTLSVFRKDDGRWRLARDANLLARDAG